MRTLVVGFGLIISGVVMAVLFSSFLRNEILAWSGAGIATLGFLLTIYDCIANDHY